VFGEPFRGSAAIHAGIVTAKELRGPRFRRLLRDVYVAAEVEVDLALRSRAAHVLVAGRGVLGGWSAAEILGASCAARDAPAEVVTRVRQRAQPGLQISHERLPPDEITEVDGIGVTTPIRTAFDLARRQPLTEAVIAVDALTHAFGFAPAEVIGFGYRHHGARGSAQLPEVVRLSNPLAESPMETRVRLAIHAAGLVAPVLQYPVGPYCLDMAYLDICLGVEYDGRDHLTQERAMRDLARQAYLSKAGWEILRFRAAEVLFHPSSAAAKVREKITLLTR